MAHSAYGHVDIRSFIRPRTAERVHRVKSILCCKFFQLSTSEAHVLETRLKSDLSRPDDPSKQVLKPRPLASTFDPLANDVTTPTTSPISIESCSFLVTVWLLATLALALIVRASFHDTTEHRAVPLICCQVNNTKVENLLSSQLFKNHPDYKDRIYPNLGRMAGYHYGDNPEFNAHGEIPALKLGSGNYKDGNNYTAEDHYNAWVKFWKEFLRERAKHGFFVEHNSNGYMLHTLRFLHDIYAWCEDQELRTQVRIPRFSLGTVRTRSKHASARWLCYARYARFGSHE